MRYEVRILHPQVEKLDRELGQDTVEVLALAERKRSVGPLRGLLGGTPF